MGWKSIRARIAAYKRWHPEADLTAMYQMLHEKYEADQLDRFINALFVTDEQKAEIRALLTK